MVVASWPSILQTHAHTHGRMNKHTHTHMHTYAQKNAPARLLVCIDHKQRLESVIRAATMCGFGCRWHLQGVMSPAVMTFHRPLHRQTAGAGGRVGGDGDRARTACSVDVSSIKASPYWPYIGAAVSAGYTMLRLHNRS